MTEAPHQPPQQPAARRPSWVVIGVAVIILLIALYVGVQVIGALFGIASPPMPPVPADAREISHSSEAYGVDDWMYDSQQPPCQVLELYESAGAVCTVSPAQCGGSPVEGLESTAGMVARCSGDIRFSQFSQRYEAVISFSLVTNGGTELRLIREINWFGGSGAASTVTLPAAP